MTQKLTIDELKNFGDVNAAIEHATSLIPTKPVQPILGRDHNTNDAKIHVKNMEKYDTDMASYKSAKESYESTKSHIEHTIEDFIKDAAGLSKIPAQSQSKVWQKAYDDGHASGYYEVYSKLSELVDLFE